MSDTHIGRRAGWGAWESSRHLGVVILDCVGTVGRAGGPKYCIGGMIEPRHCGNWNKKDVVVGTGRQRAWDLSEVVR